jgi:hypothetical protein
MKLVSESSQVDGSFGNGEDVYVKSDNNQDRLVASLDELVTSATILELETYNDVFAYFWSKTNKDWPLHAGFTASNLIVFRSGSPQCAEAGQLI